MSAEDTAPAAAPASQTPDAGTAPAAPKKTEPDTRPVYDKRGNVRPRGTPGARPMTYAERVKIARKLNNT